MIHCFVRVVLTHNMLAVYWLGITWLFLDVFRTIEFSRLDFLRGFRVIRNQKKCLQVLFRVVRRQKKLYTRTFRLRTYSLLCVRGFRLGTESGRPMFAGRTCGAEEEASDIRAREWLSIVTRRTEKHNNNNRKKKKNHKKLLLFRSTRDGRADFGYAHTPPRPCSCTCVASALRHTWWWPGTRRYTCATGME